MSGAGAVVVGASLAGIRTVQALRRNGYDRPITLVGAEAQLPYDRPPLSKEFLLGKLGAEDVALVAPAALTALEVDVRLGTRATALDLATRTVTAGGEQVRYDVLVVATGSTPRTLGGVDDLDGVHALRTLEDAEAIRARFAAGARVAVVGGGFIGAEVATAARRLGLDVTIIDPLPTLMTRGLGDELGGVLAHRHADNGVRMRLGRVVSRIEGHRGVERLVLDDESVVDADLVVVGIGVDPAVGWLAGSGLELTGGVACDASLRAAEAVYAVGDVARWTHGRVSRRLEHWTNAGDQATALAATLTGSGAAYDPLPYVWSDQLGSRLQVWGAIEAGDELCFLHGHAGSDEFVVAAGSGTTLHAVVAFGARRDAVRASRLLRSGATWRSGHGPVEAA